MQNIQTGTYQEILEEKFTEEQIEELTPKPATPYQMATLRDVMMRKHSTSYQPPRKHRKAA